MTRPDFSIGYADVSQVDGLQLLRMSRPHRSHKEAGSQQSEGNRASQSDGHFNRSI
jgi:hypothetical protein